MVSKPSFRNRGLGRTKLPEKRPGPGLSHLVTVYIKEHTGKISPICGCSVAAGAGPPPPAPAAGRGCRHREPRHQNIIASLAGVFCDGSKNGCALKLAATAAEAVLAAKLAIRGLSADQLDGIIGKTAEQTIANLGYVSTHGLGQTDAAILTVMRGEI